jgi:drug/metabolite transporter superfamily protein YnfA
MPRIKASIRRDEIILSETKATENWFARRAEAEAKKDIIPYSERVGNIAGVVVGFLVVLYFVTHQTSSTGFFTSKFDTLEMLLFYGSLMYGIVSTALKGVVGRKNLVRFFDVFGGIFIAVAIIWLFVVFPFDFAYLADVLPSFLRFLVQWISNDIARVLMVLGIIVALVMAIYTAILYVFVRRELSKPTL